MSKLARALALSALVCACVSASGAIAAPPKGEGVAWDIVADLTTEIGPRLAGSEREAAAREWSVVRLKTLGFQNVRVEPFTFPGWVRGAEAAKLTGPYPHKLHITALGYSGPTPPGGITAPVAYFASLDALKTAPEGSLLGKIAFIDHTFTASQDGLGYGHYGPARREGPMIGAGKGALAVVIRSLGTDHNRDPHTGTSNIPAGRAAIPAGAVSGPDADLIGRIAATGKAMTMHLMLEGRSVGDLPSGNVIAELPGRDPSLAPVLLACHLDSWDLGTGALDDGAGCGIVAEAALGVHKAGKPLRTIRLLWAGAEEVGVFGGAAYARANAAQPHALVMESDLGADRIWRVSFDLAEANRPLAQKISAALAAMGIPTSAIKATGGADVRAIAALQKPGVIDLGQDATRYFDLHHTPSDTLDKVDPAQLAQNVAAWTAVVGIVANEAGPIAGQ